MLFGSAGAQDLTGIWRGHFRSSETSKYEEIYQRMTGEDDRYKMEVQIAQESNHLQAVTYSYKSNIFYGKASADGKDDPISNKVLIRELKILEVRMAQGAACIMTCNMKYSKLSGEEFLEGTYSSMNTQDSTDCGKGTIFLHKVENSDFYKEPFLIKQEKKIEEKKGKPEADGVAGAGTPEVSKKPPRAVPSTTGRSLMHKRDSAAKGTTRTHINNPTRSTPVKPGGGANPDNSTVKTPPVKHKAPRPAPALVKSPPSETVQGTESKRDSLHMVSPKPLQGVLPEVLINRSNEVVRTIDVSSPEVELDIYDDGVIDNDSVTVYFDNRLVVFHQMLTERPIVVKLQLDQSPGPHKVVMVADNEGTIPPNTSLMIVKAGTKQYEVRIVSTEQKNAVVIFNYHKPE
jgi:hypothetical protein